MDWLSLSSIIGWLMELSAKGIINTNDTDGLPIERGNKETILTLTKLIAKREGIGDILSNGILKAAKKIGRGSEKYAMQTRGLEKHPYEFRAFLGHALSSAVGNRGDSIRGIVLLETSIWGSDGVNEKKELAKKMFGSEKAILPDKYEGKAKMVHYYENAIAAVDSLSFCKFIIPLHFKTTLEIPVTLFTLVTGENISINKLLDIGEKICTIERAFNAREGLTRKDDMLPERFFNEPVKGGFSNNKILDYEKFEAMKSEYYTLRGFDITTGNPTKKRLEEMGLKEVADDLAKWDKLPR
jgi:aldehyde:ferredoxin oxidoreductase